MRCGSTNIILLFAVLCISCGSKIIPPLPLDTEVKSLEMSVFDNSAETPVVRCSAGVQDQARIKEILAFLDGLSDDWRYPISASWPWEGEVAVITMSGEKHFFLVHTGTVCRLMSHACKVHSLATVQAAQMWDLLPEVFSKDSCQG